MLRVSARERAPGFAVATEHTPSTDEYMASIPFAYIGLLANAVRHELAPPGNKAKMRGREREELPELLLLDATELTFTPRGSPDPRLLRLVDFLARQAARECYAEEVKMTKRRGKRTS
ncbi:MAG: hypothetical protein QHC90_29895 [Shinella sp.]|nr:hypothetical protein [Shinella sp.]